MSVKTKQLEKMKYEDQILEIRWGEEKWWPLLGKISLDLKAIVKIDFYAE